MTAATGIGITRDIEYINGGIINMIIKQILQAPAHGALKLFRWYVERLD